MTLEVYNRKFGKIEEQTLMSCSGKDVIFVEVKKDYAFVGRGILNFDVKEPDVCYLVNGNSSRRLNVSDLEEITIPSEI
jgi:hypothetical protein